MIDGLVNFNLDEVSPTIIKVIGVGGGGGNAVEYMYSKGICDVDFVVCNVSGASAPPVSDASDVPALPTRLNLPSPFPTPPASLPP